MKMRSYNFCHTNTKNPGNNLGIFCLITGRPKLNGYGINIRFTDIRPGFIDTPLLHGDKFPHTLSADKASRSILKAIYRNKHVAYIDGLWHAVVLLMRLVPRTLWRRMNLNRV